MSFFVFFIFSCKFIFIKKSKSVTEFKAKSEIFNSFLVQVSSIENDSVNLFNITAITERKLADISFPYVEILNLISTLLA